MKTNYSSPPDWFFERMTEDHLEEVLEIEKKSFPEPYTRELFIEELNLKIAFPHILKEEKKIIGFIDYWIVLDEIHLITLAIDPSFRQKGAGAFLMTHLDSVMEKEKLKKIFLDVRKSNQKAIELYKKFEFKVVGVRKKYYSDGEDALVMEKRGL